MTRRILSGVFLLLALGVLGVILAGALTSGEQLIVRFLTAVIVAALALYVISDLRLQANDDDAAASQATIPTPRITVPEDPPPNSTAAFMATVTGKRASNDSSHPISADEFSSDAEALGLSPEEDERALVGVGVGPDAASDPQTDLESTIDAWASAAPPFSVSAPVAASSTQGDNPGRVAEDYASQDPPVDDADSPYDADLDEAARWPFNDTPATTDATDAAPVEGDEIDGLVAMFARQTEQEMSERAEQSETPTLASNEVRTATAEIYETDETPAVELATIGEALTTEMPEGAERSQETTDGDDQTEMVTDSGVEADGARVVATDYADQPIAPIIDLRSAPSAVGVDAAIRSGEIGVIATLMEQGLLSTEGPITDRDVRTMVYVAYTSSELRKILTAGGTIDGQDDHPVPGLDGGLRHPHAFGEGEDGGRFTAMPVAPLANIPEAQAL